MNVPGKKEKYFELLDKAYPRLQRYALSLLKNREDAKDLVQDTVLAGYQNFWRLKNDEAFLSFIFTIARRKRIDNYRKMKHVSIIDNEVFDDIIYNGTNAEDMTDIKILKEALEKLPDKLKEAIILHELIGLKIKEIAKIQETTTANVKIRLYRAKNKLRAFLSDKKIIPEKNKLLHENMI